MEQLSSARASLIAQLVNNLPAMQETPFDSWVGKIHWRRDRQPTPVFLGFPCDSAGKESACNAGDLGLIPGLGRSLEKGKATHSSILENAMDIVHRVTKSRTKLSDFHFTLHLMAYWFSLGVPCESILIFFPLLFFIEV